MNLTAIFDIVVIVLLVGGALIHVISSFGLIRLPDVLNRSHAATKSATLGVIFVLIGAFLFFWIEEGIISAKLLLGIMFVLFTSPVAGHLIGRAAYRSGTPLWEKTEQDALKDTAAYRPAEMKES